MPVLPNSMPDGWTYRLRYIRCGKQTCHCANGDGHGPYWYAYRHRERRLETRYVGQRPPEAAFDDPVAPSDPPSASQPPPPRANDEVAAPRPGGERWGYSGRMTARAALRIFAFTERPDERRLQARYRQLVKQHHPDHGGDAKITAAIIAAYQVLRARRGRGRS